MRKFQILITANTKNDSVLIYHETITLNEEQAERGFTAYPGQRHPFRSWLKSYMPLNDWQLDDGEDTDGSTYCQYVDYTGTDMDKYLLAAWNEIDPITECIIL